MPTLTYPSQTFPGSPHLTLPLPEGWQALPPSVTPTALVAAVRPGEPEEFRANIIVSVEAVSADHTPSADLQGVALDATRRTDGTVAEPYMRTISGQTFVGRDMSWVDEDAGTLLASTLFGYVQHTETGQLDRITVTATIGSVDHVEVYRTVHDAINQLHVQPADGTVGLVAADAAPTEGE